jgi:hypothetical protein
MSGHGGTPLSKIQATDATQNNPNTTDSNSNPTFNPQSVAGSVAVGGAAAAAAVPAQSTATTAFSATNSTKVDVSAATINANFQPNILNNYVTYSYYFILFMLPANLYNQRGSAKIMSNATPKMIIAETGATGLNIKDVSVNMAVGANNNGTNSMAADITIDLVEPAGFTFYDKIYQASIQLGLSNYTQVPYFLGLKFQGYDANGNLADPIGGLQYLWPMVLQKIDSNFKDGFGHYSISAKLLNETGESDLTGRIKTQFSTSTHDLKTFFNEFAMFCQKSQLEYRLAALGLSGTNSATVNVPTDKYQIILHDNSWTNPPFDASKQTIKISGDNPNLHPNRAGTFSTDQKGQTIVSFAKDTPIREVIDLAMSSVPFIQEIANRSKTSDSSDGASIQQIYSQIWRVEVEMTINTDANSYDWVMNDYTRTYTYHIYNYKTRRPVLLPEAGSGETSSGNPNFDLSQPTLQRAAISGLQTDKFLVKRYDYLYTGLNTEILNLDLQFNFMWAASLASFQGIRDYATNTNPAMFNTDGAARAKAQTLGAQIKVLEQKLNVANQNILTALGFAGEPTNTNTQKSVAVNTAQAALQQQIAVLKQQQINNANVVASNPRNFNVPTLTTNQYIEDLTNNMVKPPPVPITIAPESISSEGRTSQSVEEAWQKGKTLLGATLNQINGIFKTIDLMQIDLDIRGDPYWFGYSITDADYYSNTKKPTSSMAFYALGEHAFALVFRFPQGFDSNGNVQATQYATQNQSGQVQLMPSDVINAIYNVWWVHSKFSSGVFTQTLKATRDVNTNVQGILS